MFSKEYDKRSCYFKMEKLKTRNIVAYKFKVCSSPIFLQLYSVLLWKAPLKFILWFHVILFMTINCYMCLTCRKTTSAKNCRKSHSRKLGYQQIILVEQTVRGVGKIPKPMLHGV